MKTVYIAAPFRGTTDDSRALWLGRLAMAMGLAPVVIHPAIRAGVYGDDGDPEARARGIEAAKAIAEQCDEAWCLYRDDGTMSEGCQYELLHRRHRSGTWAQWQEVARVLHPELVVAAVGPEPEPEKVAWTEVGRPWP